jgi:hypothetical protein
MRLISFNSLVGNTIISKHIGDPYFQVKNITFPLYDYVTYIIINIYFEFASSLINSLIIHAFVKLFLP